MVRELCLRTAGFWCEARCTSRDTAPSVESCAISCPRRYSARLLRPTTAFSVREEDDSTTATSAEMSPLLTRAGMFFCSAVSIQTVDSARARAACPAQSW